MSYRDEVAAVVVVSRDELEGDLRLAKANLERLRRELGVAQRHVASFEALLAFDASGPADSDGALGHVTLHVAMATVLADAPAQMMRAADLATAISARGLYTMRDGRPVEAQQVHARVGNYPDLFEREGTFIKLK